MLAGHQRLSSPRCARNSYFTRRPTFVLLHCIPVHSQGALSLKKLAASTNSLYAALVTSITASTFKRAGQLTLALTCGGLIKVCSGGLVFSFGVGYGVFVVVVCRIAKLWGRKSRGRNSPSAQDVFRDLHDFPKDGLVRSIAVEICCA